MIGERKSWVFLEMGSSASKVQPNVPRNAANSRVPNVRVPNVRTPNLPVSQNVAANVYAKNQDPVNPNARPRGNSIYNEAMATPTIGGRRKTRSRKNKKSRKSKK